MSGETRSHGIPKDWDEATIVAGTHGGFTVKLYKDSASQASAAFDQPRDLLAWLAVAFESREARKS